MLQYGNLTTRRLSIQWIPDSVMGSTHDSDEQLAEDVENTLPEKTLPTGMVFSMITWHLWNWRIPQASKRLAFRLLEAMIDRCERTDSLELTVVYELGTRSLLVSW